MYLLPATRNSIYFSYIQTQVNIYTRTTTWYTSLTLLREPISLNKISIDCTVEMIRKVITAGVNVQEIYIDTVGKNRPK